MKKDSTNEILPPPISWCLKNSPVSNKTQQTAPYVSAQTKRQRADQLKNLNVVLKLSFSRGFFSSTVQ